MDLGSGQDTLTFGDYAFLDGMLSIEQPFDTIGDTYSFGDNAAQANGSIELEAGFGDDTITFGANDGANSGYIFVQSRSGADQISFGTGAENLDIDLGSGTSRMGDGDSDTLTFLGTVTSTRISSWEHGVDLITFTASTGLWTAVDGANGWKVFTSIDGQSFNVSGAAGFEATEIVSGLSYNTAPSYVGMGDVTDDAGNHYYDMGLAGSGTEAATFDLNALFSDLDAAVGDSFTISVDALSAGLSLTDGVLSVLNTGAALAHTAAGDHVVNVTATDASGASVTQTLRLSIALDHDFGDTATVSSVTGSSFDDRVTFGEYPAVFSSMTVSLGEGEDTLIFADRGGVESTLTLDTGADDDTIEFGHFAAVTGNVSIASGGGNDSITLGDHAATASGTLSITDTGGNTVISFGNNAGVTNGVVNITLDDGADQVSFGINAGTDNGEISIASGAGADQFIFDDNAANLMIDLGQDSDTDSVTFLGSVHSATIENWEEGVDIVDVLDPSTWTLMVDGTDTTLSNGVSDIRFAGITGLTDVSDFLI
ncbi:hypothetical protein, partial [Planktotalea sp.]|uniref:hypothetical protein n=1 Tax=Planktotalea sp. TaxID=2029877 RepID=UPI0032978EF9